VTAQLIITPLVTAQLILTPLVTAQLITPLRLAGAALTPPHHTALITAQLITPLVTAQLIITPLVTAQLLNAGEGPPTLQSTVIPAWNYAPQLLGKVTPTFSPVVDAARI